MEEVNGHVLDVVRAIRLLPNRDNDDFSEVKVGGCADEFWDGPQRWGEVFHDAGDRCIGKSLKFLVMGNGTDGVG